MNVYYINNFPGFCFPGDILLFSIGIVKVLPDVITLLFFPGCCLSSIVLVQMLFFRILDMLRPCLVITTIT